jgi:hypothetical protein
MKYAGALISLLSVFALHPAAAATYKVTQTAPIVRITVPENWKPHPSDETVDGLSPDEAVNFWVAVLASPDAAAAKADALAALERNGLKIDAASAEETPSRIGALSGVAATYAASEDGKGSIVKIDILAIRNKRVLQIVRWGSPDAIAKHQAALTSILATIKQ